jgi:uncharacterized coiled-coil protein SlyX
VGGQTSGTGNDGTSARDPQSTAATGQETPASGQGDNPGEAVKPHDATKLPKASSDHGEPQDPVEEADATEALKRRIAELEAESAAKDAVIAEQQDAIETKDSTIASQWRKITELDYRAGDLEDENGRLKDEKAAPGTSEANPEHGADVPDASQDQSPTIGEHEGTGQGSDAKEARTLRMRLRKVRDTVDAVASSDNLSIAKSAVTGGVGVGAATQDPTWGAVGAVVAGVLDFFGQVRKKQEKK